jgi:hypothetical protein
VVSGDHSSGGTGLAGDDPDGGVTRSQSGKVRHLLNLLRHRNKMKCRHQHGPGTPIGKNPTVTQNENVGHGDITSKGGKWPQGSVGALKLRRR